MGSFVEGSSGEFAVTPGDLQIGQAYYRITYADPELTIPSLKAMIYIGTNIFPDDDADLVNYYFQDTVSYFARGAATDEAASARHPEIDTLVFPVLAQEIGSSIVSLEGAIEALRSAKARSR
jgi:hypothetical protein